VQVTLLVSLLVALSHLRASFLKNCSVGKLAIGCKTPEANMATGKKKH
jgi:hypothetical protein